MCFFVVVLGGSAGNVGGILFLEFLGPFCIDVAVLLLALFLNGKGLRPSDIASLMLVGCLRVIGEPGVVDLLRCALMGIRDSGVVTAPLPLLTHSPNPSSLTAFASFLLWVAHLTDSLFLLEEVLVTG